jgi:4-amino-4-deoxy-L-arabinose transferase-like glycosyltransferase
MSKRLLMPIVIIALTLRLVNALFIPWQDGDLIVSDMKGYDRAAVALLRHEPLGVHTAERYLFHPLGSDTYHPPGYYYFLAGVYALAGHSYTAVRVAQAFVDTLTCLLIYLLGREIFGEAAGLLAAGLAALYPPLIFYTGVLLTESLTTLLLTGASWLLLRGIRTRRRSRHVLLVLAGLLLGLAIITRSVLLTTVPLALLWLLLVAERWPGWKRAARYALSMLAPIILVIAPITIRNYQIHGQFILISTNGGVNFFLGHGGTQSLKDKVRNLPEVFSEGEIIGISSRTQPEEEAYFYQLGWEYIRGHALPTLRSLPGKLRSMYWASDYWPASDVQASILRSIDLVFWRLLLLPLSFVGLLLFRGQKQRRTALLYLLVLSTVAIPLIFWAQPRFRMPVVPCFLILAAGTVYELYRRFTRKAESRLEGIAA